MTQGVRAITLLDSLQPLAPRHLEPSPSDDEELPFAFDVDDDESLRSSPERKRRQCGSGPCDTEILTERHLPPGYAAWAMGVDGEDHSEVPSPTLSAHTDGDAMDTHNTSERLSDSMESETEIGEAVDHGTITNTTGESTDDGRPSSPLTAEATSEEEGSELESDEGASEGIEDMRIIAMPLPRTPPHTVESTTIAPDGFDPSAEIVAEILGETVESVLPNEEEATIEMQENLQIASRALSASGRQISRLHTALLGLVVVSSILWSKGFTQLRQVVCVEQAPDPSSFQSPSASRSNKSLKRDSSSPFSPSYSSTSAPPQSQDAPPSPCVPSEVEERALQRQRHRYESDEVVSHLLTRVDALQTALKRKKEGGAGLASPS